MKVTDKDIKNMKEFGMKYYLESSQVVELSFNILPKRDINLEDECNINELDKDIIKTICSFSTDTDLLKVVGTCTYEGNLKLNPKLTKNDRMTLYYYMDFTSGYYGLEDTFNKKSAMAICKFFKKIDKTELTKKLYDLPIIGEYILDDSVDVHVRKIQFKMTDLNTKEVKEVFN